MVIAALYVSDTSSHSCALSSPRSVNYMVTNTVNSSMTPFGVHLFTPEQQLILEKKLWPLWSLFWRTLRGSFLIQ